MEVRDFQNVYDLTVNSGAYVINKEHIESTGTLIGSNESRDLRHPIRVRYFRVRRTYTTLEFVNDNDRSSPGDKVSWLKLLSCECKRFGAK